MTAQTHFVYVFTCSPKFSF